MSLLGTLMGRPFGTLGSRGIGRGSLSPIAIGLLGLLAYKAVKGRNDGGRTDAGAQPAGGAPGGLDGLLSGLGSSGAAGLGGLAGALSNGIGDLVKQFRNAGKGDVADSWVNRGDNKPIPPTDLSKVLTAEQIEFLTDRTGMSREQLLEGLSQELPEAVDKLTPEGRVPTPDELQRAA